MPAQTNLFKLAKDVIQARRLEEAGAGEPQIRQEPRWLADERIPGSQLRPWATKMQLRPDEEAALELVREQTPLANRCLTPISMHACACCGMPGQGGP